MTFRFQNVSHAEVYSKFRHLPPDDLIANIVSYLKSKVQEPLKNAVDVGCGSGQSTIALAPYFKSVTGLDVSDAQIEMAKQQRGAANVNYRVSEAATTGVADSSVELVAVCQAMHWFDLDEFFSEVKRILVPNGVLAAYGYYIPLPKEADEKKSKEFYDLVFNYLRENILGKYIDPRSNMQRYHYRDIDFPFKDIVRKIFIMETVVTVADYVNYFTTWSDFQMFREEDPEQAEKVLQHVQDRLMQIIGAKTPPESTNLTLCSEYGLLMGHK